MNTKLNKSDYIILAIFYVISVVLNAFDYYRDDNDLIEFLVDIPMYVITSLLGVLVFMYWIIPEFLVRQKKFFHFAFLGLVVITLIGVIERVVGFLSSGLEWSEFPPTFNLILYSIFNGSDSIGLPLGVLLTKKFYEGQTQLVKVKEQQKENELKLLRSQLDPHFLFNNLNTLDALIDSNPIKAKEYINRLSLIYRYLIQTKDAEVMELSEEINLAENYIFLIKTRFENDYQFNIEKKASLIDKFIPTGAIQTLLENVVKHNKSLNSIPIKATIIIDEATLTVINTKSNAATSKDSFGTGIQNLKTRYQLLSDKEVQIINTEKEFKITIPIIKLSIDN